MLMSPEPAEQWTGQAMGGWQEDPPTDKIHLGGSTIRLCFKSTAPGTDLGTAGSGASTGP